MRTHSDSYKAAPNGEFTAYMQQYIVKVSPHPAGKLNAPITTTNCALTYCTSLVIFLAFGVYI